MSLRNCSLSNMYKVRGNYYSSSNMKILHDTKTFASNILNKQSNTCELFQISIATYNNFKFLGSNYHSEIKEKKC